jgi:UDP-glucose 4-epimerase
MAAFIKQKAAGAALLIYGDGDQTRDFTHVDDVVRANLLAMESPRVGKGEVINIGAGENHSVNEIAKFFGGPVEYLPARPGEMRHTLADTSRGRDLLGWEPRVKFQDGLKRI